MKNLSKKQQEIVDKMKQGAYIDRTFYPRQIVAYLKFDGIKERSIVSLATVGSLEAKGIIEYDKASSSFAGMTHHIFRLKQ